MGLQEKLKELKDLPNRIELTGDGAKDLTDEKEEPKPKKEEPAKGKNNDDTGVEEKADEPKDKKDERDSVSADAGESAEQPADKPADKPTLEYRERKVKDAEADLQRERERADRLERALLERQPAKEEPKARVEPDRMKDPEAWAVHMLTQGVEGQKEIKKELDAIKNNNAIRAAEDELSGLENSYRAKRPDYDEAMKYAEDLSVKRGLRMNPKASEGQLRADFKKDKLRMASQMAIAGRDPVEELYNFVLDSGYKPSVNDENTAAGETQSKADKETKNFDAVKKNKAKGASPLAAGGKSAGTSVLGPDDAKGMTLSQFAKLSPEEKKQVFPNDLTRARR